MPDSETSTLMGSLTLDVDRNASTLLMSSDIASRFEMNPSTWGRTDSTASWIAGLLYRTDCLLWSIMDLPYFLTLGLNPIVPLKDYGGQSRPTEVYHIARLVS